MVDDIERRGLFLQGLQGIHETEDVLGIVEVTGTHILNLHHYRIEFLKHVYTELDMVGQRGQLGIARREHGMEIATLTEYLVHVSSLFRIPAVLGTETADPAFKQGLVKLIFKGCCPERKHYPMMFLAMSMIC